MRSVLRLALIGLFVWASSIAAGAQPSPGPAIRDFFSGQQMLVTYREGGPVYGTFYTLQVHFCRSGRYMTFGESRRHTVLDNEQVSRITDEGTWEIVTVGGHDVLRYLSASGQANGVAINVAANGRITLGDGSITVIKQGLAQCAR